MFATFEERYGADLDGRSTLLVMGDARNNYRDPGPGGASPAGRAGSPPLLTQPEPEEDE